MVLGRGFFGQESLKKLGLRQLNTAEQGLNGETMLDFVFLAVFHILGKERCFDDHF